MLFLNLQVRGQTSIATHFTVKQSRTKFDCNIQQIRKSNFATKPAIETKLPLSHQIQRKQLFLTNEQSQQQKQQLRAATDVVSGQKFLAASGIFSSVSFFRNVSSVVSIGHCQSACKGNQLSFEAKVPSNFSDLLSSRISKRFVHRQREERMASKLAPTIKLNNGYEMPVLGLGTYESKDNEAAIAVKHAIDVGYRHIDTAYFYQNEAEVGNAINEKIAAGVVKREEIFLVTKLWNIHHEPDRVEGACRKQLANFKLGYIDLYLMHLPVGYKYVDEITLLPKNDEGVLQLSDVDYLDTYKAMEKLVKLGLVRSIGVSNFNSAQLKRVLDNCEIKPVTNQVECSPHLNQKKLTQFCKEQGVTLTAYSPLGRPKPVEKTPDFYFSDRTKALAEKHKKTPAQIILRYLIDIGTIPIPKSSNPQRIAENFNIFDFSLSAEDIAVMDSFHTGDRLVPFNLIKGQNHKYFPFNIEY